MAISYSPTIVRDGLVCYLDAANPKSYPGSGTIWTDLSGNGISGNFIGSVEYTNNNKGSMKFDGTDDFILLSNPASDFINTNYTWNLWVIGRHSTEAGILHNMPDFGYGSSSWPRLGFRERNGNWEWLMYNGSGPDNSIILVICPSSNNNWINLTVVADYNQTEIRAYSNGKLQNSVGRFTDTTGNSGALGIGRAGNTALSWNEAFIGESSVFSIYNRNLTPKEIQQNYNALKGRYGL